MRRYFVFLTLLVALPLLAQAQGTTLPDFTTLVERHSPAVVNITTIQEGRALQRRGNMPSQDEMFEFFRRFMPPEGRGFLPPRRGQGSGFIISADGYILTNAHVVDGADEVVVKLHDKRELRARVVGADTRTDIALIKIDTNGLPTTTIGNPDQLKVGEWVLAIGAPFGFENSVTAGIVSAKGRSLPQENYVPFIQTDVAVNPGNSGGPLFNLRGEVVGVNSQIISRSGGYMGLSFAIPIDVAMDVAEQLKRKGRVSRGRLGVAIQEVTADLAESFGLDRPRGALIAHVEPGSPAETAGLQAADIVLTYDGKPVRESIDLPRLVGATAPGTQVVLQVWRKGRMENLKVTVGEMPDEQPGPGEAGKSGNRAGLVVSSLTAEQKRQLQIASGVRVEAVSGAAARADIRPGDIIVAVNNLPVNSAEELGRALNDPKRSRFALLIRRGEGNLYVALRLD